VEIRRARARDARDLSRIAHAAKAYWGYPEVWLRLWRHELTVTARFIEEHDVFCALRDGWIVGFYALSREGPAFELEHLWVDPDDIGGGLAPACSAMPSSALGPPAAPSSGSCPIRTRRGSTAAWALGAWVRQRRHPPAACSRSSFSTSVPRARSAAGAARSR
jgi:hypothetical protein